MKSIKKMYRFLVRKSTPVRIAIFVNVTLLAVALCLFLALFPGLMTGLLFVIVIALYIIFLMETILAGMFLDYLEDVLVEYRRFK